MHPNDRVENLASYSGDPEFEPRSEGSGIFTGVVETRHYIIFCAEEDSMGNQLV